jgi:hypothetical protein
MKKCSKNNEKINIQEKNYSTNEYEKFDVIDKTLLLNLLKQNSELQQKIIELTDKSNMTINNNNHVNSHNKQFNLNFFLNETCKNAMNMTDFIDSLEIKATELEDFGKLGYVKGISNIFIRGLNELDETERPMHCTDKKRETFYIKENNIWEKETASKEKIKKAIKAIVHKNFKRLPKWCEDNPASEDITSKKNMEYMHILNQVMTGISPDDNGFNKIIKCVSAEVYLDKADKIF